MKVAVYGFYHSRNLGDDAFVEAIKLILGSRQGENKEEDCQLDFLRASEMTAEETQRYDAVVVGGGDLMNDFFGAKFQEVLPAFTGYKLALGVGFSYQACLSRPYVRLFDDVIMRSPADLPALSRQLGSLHAHAMPDLTFALPLPLAPGEEKRRKSVGFFLVDSLRKQRSFFFAICSLGSWLLSQGYDLELFAMCADPGGDDDREINRRIMETFQHTGRVTSHPEMTLDQFLRTAAGLTFAVCARFHAHVFCARLGVPFVSLPITRKTELFMAEIPEEGAISVPIIRSNYLPVAFEAERAQEAILCLERNDVFCGQSVQSVQSFFLAATREQNKENRCQTARTILRDWARRQEAVYQLESKPRRLLLNGRKRLTGPSRASLVDPEQVYHKYLRKILHLGLNPLTDKLAEAGEKVVSQIAEELCYDLTLDPANDYVYGTKENLAQRTETLRDMIYWIYGDDASRRVGKKINFDYMKQDSFRGLHRSGWQFAIDGVAALGDSHGVLCDTYLDRAFGWACGMLTQDGIIPYTNHWVGFFHHTFEQEFAPRNNLGQVFANPSFLASLPHCRGIFVLTEYLARQVRQALRDLGYEIEVCALHHPTEFPRRKFSPADFLANEDKKLINVGAWYRNPVTIHTVPRGYLRPVSLRGKRMAANFPPERLSASWKESFVGRERQSLSPCQECQTRELDVPGNIWAQYWARLLNEEPESPLTRAVQAVADGVTDLRQVKEVQDFIERVEVLETVADDGYDNLLAENVVFLDLVDASAANTVVECIVRGTPLVARRISPLEEALGPDYPLFWGRRDEIAALLTEEKILQAHQYLRDQVERRVYRLENFYQEMAGSRILRDL